MAIKVTYSLQGQVEVKDAYVKLIGFDARRTATGWSGNGRFGVFVDRNAAQPPAEKATPPNVAPLFVGSRFTKPSIDEVNVGAEWGIDDNAAKAFYAAAKLNDVFKGGLDV